MWGSGAIMPEHANISHFIVMHEELLKQDFFESLTRLVLHTCGSDSARAAGDGTVIEAACSHYKLRKEEAIKEHAQAMRERLAQQGNDGRAQQLLRQSEDCQSLFQQRKAARIKRGKDASNLCISATEPEAVVHRLKRGRGFAPA